MALSDNPAAKKRSPKKRALSTGSNHSWSDKQKIEAVQSWLLLGNLALTSRVLGIPEITLRVWKTTEWWKNTVEDIKLQENMQMSARLKKIVDASLGAVEDRIVNGDFMFDQKSGEMVRKQVNLRDAHKVAVDLLDKRAMLDKAAAPQQEEKQDEDRLLKLAEKFAEFVTKKKDPLIIDAEDVEIKSRDNSEAEGQSHKLEVVGSSPAPATILENVDALHDQWEEGLREGISPVPQSPRADTQSVGENHPTEASQ